MKKIIPSICLLAILSSTSGYTDTPAASTIAQPTNMFNIIEKVALTSGVVPNWMAKVFSMYDQTTSSGDTSVTDMENILQSMNIKLSDMQQYEKQIKNDMDSSFLTQYQNSIKTNLKNINNLLKPIGVNSDSSSSSSMIQSNNMTDQVDSVYSLYRYLFPNNLRNKPSSKKNLIEYVSNALIGKMQNTISTADIQNLMSLIDNNNFINNLKNNPEYLPNASSMSTITSQIKSDITQDVGKDAYYINLKLLQSAYEIGAFMQKEYITSQALIILKYKDSKYKDLDLQAVLTNTDFKNLNLKQALQQNNQRFKNSAHAIGEYINSLYINTMGMLKSSTGIQTINYPTKDSNCYVVSFIPSGNEFTLKCESPSNNNLANLKYHATVGQLINQQVFSSNITLTNQSLTYAPGIGEIKFNPIAKANYQLFSFADLFDDNDINWADVEEPVIGTNYPNINNDYAKDILYSFQNQIHQNNTFRGQYNQEYQLSQIIYMPYSGSFVQLNADGIPSNGNYTIGIETTKNNPEILSSQLPDGKWLDGTGWSLDNYSNKFFRQVAFDSGEAIIFSGDIEQSTDYTISHTFHIYKPLQFKYDKKIINIGGDWLSHYNRALSSIIISPSQKGYPVHIVITSNNQTIFNSDELSKNAKFFTELNEIKDSNNTVNTIDFSYKEGTNNINVDL